MTAPTTRLSPAEIARFRAEGVVFPVRALPEAEAAARLYDLEAVEARGAGRLPPSVNAKPHLLLPWLWDLVHDARIVDAVDDLIGPDLLCLGSSFISKSPGDARHVSWHQDATHWGLSSPEAVTAWVALTPSTSDNGCVRVLPGTHAHPVPHDNPDDRLNMLGRKERVCGAIDEHAAVDVVLAPGQMSLHHPLLIHGSAPNRSTRRRTGFAIRYIPAHVTQTRGRRNFATLVRGRDRGHFDLETAPEHAFDREALIRHARVLRKAMEILFDDA